MKFYCLQRARMAKHDVLARILTRNVSDGEWITDREKGAAYLKSLREEFMLGKSPCEILESHPEIRITYRHDLKKHEVVFLANTP